MKPLGHVFLIPVTEQQRICKSCPLATCVTEESAKCPLRKADRLARSSYKRTEAFRERQRKRKADRTAGIGYWPEGIGKVVD